MKDPVRLLDDPEVSAGLRRDLEGLAAAAPPAYDVGAGLARFEAALGGHGGGGSGDAPGGDAPGGGSPGGGTPGGGAPVPGGGALGPATAFGLQGVLGGLAAGLVVGGVIWFASESPAPAPPPPPPAATVAAITTASAEPIEAPPSPAPPTSTSASRPAPKAVETSSEATLAEEVAQLALVRAEARRNPARALALADEGQRTFPRGVLSQEREAIAISSLAALGRTGEARARAEAFLSRHPESPFAERIRKDAGLATAP